MANANDKLTDPLLEFPGYLLRRASIAVLGGLNQRLEAFDLRHTESSLLQLIRANPGIKQSDACRALEIKRANMVPLVAKLEARGLISRTPIDGRSQAIALTKAGRELANAAFAVIQTFERQLTERVPKHLRSAIAPILLALWRDDCAREYPQEASL